MHAVYTLTEIIPLDLG